MAKVSDQVNNLNSYKLTMDLQGGNGTSSVSAKGDGQYQRNPLALSFNFSTFTAAGLNVPGVKMVVANNNIYMSLGDLTGGKWVKLDASSQLGSIVNQVNQIDPNKQLRLLLSSKDTKLVGTETVDGSATTHYTSTVNVNDLASISGLDQSSVDQLRQAFQQSGVTSITYDLWIDNNFAPRQIKATTPSALGNITVTMHISDINKPVSVTAPSDSDLTTFPGM